jgi:uncharacterized protein YqjF (DUF2071 family)
VATVGAGSDAAGGQMIDRIAPTRRPQARPIGYQDWRALLFLHWPVPAEALRPLVPASLSLDLHEGVAYVGVIPFVVKRLRPALVPAGLGLDFLETNTRTYVHVEGRDPGVYFFSLDAASLLAVWGARAGFGLPYFHARMAARRHDGVVEYAMRRRSEERPRLAVRYELGEQLGASPPGTLEHFLLERYLLHVERGGVLWTTQVHHRPYPARRARVLALHDELVRAAGLPEPAGPPPLVHYAAGVDVETFAPRPAGS